jgi:hypothetical protein
LRNCMISNGLRIRSILTMFRDNTWFSTADMHFHTQGYHTNSPNLWWRRSEAQGHCLKSSTSPHSKIHVLHKVLYKNRFKRTACLLKTNHLKPLHSRLSASLLLPLLSPLLLHRKASLLLLKPRHLRQTLLATPWPQLNRSHHFPSSHKHLHQPRTPSPLSPNNPSRHRRTPLRNPRQHLFRLNPNRQVSNPARCRAPAHLQRRLMLGKKRPQLRRRSQQDPPVSSPRARPRPALLRRPSHRQHQRLIPILSQPPPRLRRSSRRPSLRNWFSHLHQLLAHRLRHLTTDCLVSSPLQVLLPVTLSNPCLARRHRPRPVRQRLLSSAASSAAQAPHPRAAKPQPRVHQSQGKAPVFPMDFFPHRPCQPPKLNRQSSTRLGTSWGISPNGSSLETKVCWMNSRHI